MSTTTGNRDVILDEATIIALQAESDRLYIQRDAADVRIREICRLLVASGEARLRAQRGTPRLAGTDEDEEDFEELDELDSSGVPDEYQNEPEDQE